MIIWRAVRDLRPRFGLSNREVKSLDDAINRELHASKRKFWKGRNSRLLRVIGALNAKRKSKGLSLLDRQELATATTGILHDAVLEQSLSPKVPATDG